MSGDLTWQRSSFCSADSCVEVASQPDGSVWVGGGVPVVRWTTPGASGNAEIVALAFSAEEWSAFLKGAKAGEFG